MRIKERKEARENSSSTQREKTRKQWETSPTELKEVCNSISKTDSESHRITERATKQKEVSNNTSLPPIKAVSGNQPIYENQEKLIQVRSNILSRADSRWIVTKPERKRPKDNLKLEGYMDLNTTFQTSYENIEKERGKGQMSPETNINLGIHPTSKVKLINGDERITQVGNKLQTKCSAFYYKPRVKKVRHRPQTSLKPNGERYFNTLSKESYKNFVIINDKLKFENELEAPKSECYFTFPQSNKNDRKLPSVFDANGLFDTTGEESLKETEEVEEVMQKLDIESKSPTNNVSETIDKQMLQQTVFVNDNEKNETLTKQDVQLTTQVKTNEQSKNINTFEKGIEVKSLEISRPEARSKVKQRVKRNDVNESDSWTIHQLDKQKRIYTRDIDNIKELGILNGTESKTIKTIRSAKKVPEPDHNTSKQDMKKINSKNDKVTKVSFTPHQKKKQKNASTIKLFDGSMDFSTTAESSFNDNRSHNDAVKTERKATAGKLSRRSGKLRNLFHESSDAVFSNSEKFYDATTYRAQYYNHRHCPAIDLGTNKSDYEFKAEVGGHQFFSPVVQ